MSAEKVFPNMSTKITDLALLGSSTMVGLAGLVESYGSLAVAAVPAVVLTIIRWQQHRMKLRHMEELHQAQLKKFLDK